MLFIHLDLVFVYFVELRYYLCPLFFIIFNHIINLIQNLLAQLKLSTEYNYFRYYSNYYYTNITLLKKANFFAVTYSNFLILILILIYQVAKIFIVFELNHMI